jgi:hypothetical protein
MRGWTSAAEEGRLTLDSLQGDLLGGSLDGRLVLRDTDRGAIAEGRLALNDRRFGADRLGARPVSRSRGERFRPI